MTVDQPFLRSLFEELPAATRTRFEEAVTRIVTAKLRGGNKNADNPDHPGDTIARRPIAFATHRCARFSLDLSDRSGNIADDYGSPDAASPEAV